MNSAVGLKAGDLVTVRAGARYMSEEHGLCEYADDWAAEVVSASGEVVIVKDDIGERFRAWVHDLARSNPEACPGCGCEPGDGITETCNHPEGCGHSKSVRDAL